MVVAFAYLLLGAVVVTIGAQVAAQALGHFALQRRLSRLLVGALFFGVDLGSLAVVLVAAGRGQTTIAVAAAFGATMVLFLGFGVALLAGRQQVPSPTRPTVLLPAAALVLGAAALANEQVTRLEGAALVLAYVAYVALVAHDGRVLEARGERVQRVAATRHSIRPEALIVFGLALAYLGAMVLVGGSIRLVAHSGLTAGFVGAAILGVLASFDEALVMVVRVRRGPSEVAASDLFGAIAASPTGVLGLAALVRPVAVDPAASSAFLAVAVLYTAAATVFLARNRGWKRAGLALVVLYGAWLGIASRL